MGNTKNWFNKQAGMNCQPWLWSTFFYDMRRYPNEIWTQRASAYTAKADSCECDPKVKAAPKACTDVLKKYDTSDKLCPACARCCANPSGKKTGVKKVNTKNWFNKQAGMNCQPWLWKTFFSDMRRYPDPIWTARA